jgi:RNA polymerase sigma-70 factor, ECF subfamily
VTGASDQELAARATGGEEEAFRELLRRYERPVFALIYRMVRDRTLAEDLAQETFVKVFNGIASYRREFKFSSWIFKIASNTAIDHLRRREPETISLDGPNEAPGPARDRRPLQLSNRKENPLEALEARELGSAIERAIGRLRPEYRACIVLRHVEGYPYEQIAEMLSLPLGTVKTYIHRARNELRGYLGGERP